MSTSDLTVDYKVLTDTQTTCSGWKSVLEGWGREIPSFMAQLIEDAPGVAAVLAEPVEDFVKSWQAADTALAYEMSIIAGNIGRFDLDLSRTDADLATVYCQPAT